MPTYDYECCDCQDRFELFQRMTEEPLKVCPKCKGRVRRLVGTGAGVIYKGAGFYTTEYRSASYKKQEEEEQGTASPAPACAKKSEEKCSQCTK